MNQAKILWIQDEFDGPINGIVEYNNEKLWFSRNESNVLDSKVSKPEEIYSLYRLDNETLNRLEKYHMEYCRVTGNPLNHGDPFIRSKNNIIKFKHDLNLSEIKGDFVCEIKESQFSNLSVPHIIK